MRIKTVFIDHYDSFSFNVIDWLWCAGLDCERIAYDDEKAMQKVSSLGLPLVLSPGPKSPADAKPSLDLIDACLGQVPILGICLGHQLLATAAGYLVKRSQWPLHGQTKKILLKPHPIFSDCPSNLQLASYHSLAAFDTNGTKDGWSVIATCENGEIQAIAYDKEGVKPAAGFQFHPESFLSQGQEILQKNCYRLLSA